MRPKTAYYWVWALKDGTIVWANQTRKPSKGTPDAARIDEDGIYRWTIEKTENFARISDWGKAAWHGAVANRLNLKRLIREEVQSRLDSLGAQLDDLAQSLGRIEQKLNEVARTSHPAQT